MALCAQKSAVCGTTAPRNSRRVLARPVRAAVDYQAPSTRTGANELEALARMSNLVSWQGSKWKGGKGEASLGNALRGEESGRQGRRLAQS